ncbi:MAG: elongation factor P [Alphaproteobacteria bacterium]
MKINGNEINPGTLIEFNGGLFRAVKVQHVKPGKGGAFAQVELKEIRTGQKLNERFRSDEKVEKVRLEQQPFSFLFADGNEYTFMNQETFDQIALNEDVVGEDQIPYLQDGMEVEIEFYESEVIGITIPEKVVMEIVEADAVVKGQTASSSYKPAKLENGVAILVPPHIEAGTKVVVNTMTGEYMERAKD